MKKAFSLMELMIVIIILGLLAAMVTPSLLSKGEQAKQKIVCVNLKTISDGFKLFKAEHGTFPTMEEGIMALIENPDEQTYKKYPSGGYLDGKNEPKDPWGNAYIYVLEENNFDLISLGSDGKEGGDGEDSDIKLSECQQ